MWLHKSPHRIQGQDGKRSLYQCHFPGFGVAYCCVNIQPCGNWVKGPLYYFSCNFWWLYISRQGIKKGKTDLLKICSDHTALHLSSFNTDNSLENKILILSTAEESAGPLASGRLSPRIKPRGPADTLATARLQASAWAAQSAWNDSPPLRSGQPSPSFTVLCKPLLLLRVLPASLPCGPCAAGSLSSVMWPWHCVASLSLLYSVSSLREETVSWFIFQSPTDCAVGAQ